MQQSTARGRPHREIDGSWRASAEILHDKRIVRIVITVLLLPRYLGIPAQVNDEYQQ
jgi:hypothetical protein